MNTSNTKAGLLYPAAAIPPGIARQRGASLFIALVALAIMMLAGLALVRSVDTSNLIAGNLTFKEAAVSASDTGIETAVAYLNATVGPAPDANLPAGCSAGTCKYYARVQNEDTQGIPSGINWSHANLAGTTVNGYTVQYIVERLCSQAGTITLGTSPTYNTAAPVCYTTPVDTKTSKKGGAGPSVSPTGVEIMYRLTVRVAGPRNTVTMLQTILGRTS